MLKILLALDDYQEQTYLHRLLTKMGFNIEVTQTDQAIGGLIMGFQPQLVFVAEKSRKINSSKLISDIKSKRPATQFILIKHSLSADLDDLVQHIIKSPVHPEELFEAVAAVSHLQKQDLISKFEKLSNSILSTKNTQPSSQFVRGSLSSKDKQSSQLEYEDRDQKYKKFLQGLEPIQPDNTTFERSRIKEFNKELRSQSEFPESPELKIDKFQYVKNLLKKK